MNFNDFQQGQPVRVYRNLTKRCYSVQALLWRKGMGKHWRVRGHSTNLHLTNATFKVNQGGYQRYLRTAQKNVHAFICGEYQGPSYTAIDDLCFAYKDVINIRYVGGAFINSVSRQPVATAARVWLNDHGVWAVGVTYVR